MWPAPQRCGLELINIMNDDGSLNAAAGAYQGMDRFDARKRLWADMQARFLGGMMLFTFCLRLGFLFVQECELQS